MFNILVLFLIFLVNAEENGNATEIYPELSLDHSLSGKLQGLAPSELDNPDWFYDFYPETTDNLTPEQEKNVWSYYSIDVLS